jgi:protein-tyrosine phosphatase
MMRLPRRLSLGVLALALALLVLAPLVGCGTTAVRQPPASVHTLKLAAVQNARDLGGWTLADGTKIPYGRVFRSGRLSNASQADLAKLRSLGVRTSIDLRSTAEAIGMGKDPGGPQGLSSTISAPMIGVNSEAGYKDMVKNQKAALAIAFRALADKSNYPLIIHCTAGKDRTGVVSALLLELLGVPRNQIVEDYLLSSGTGRVDQDWIDAALNEVDAEGGISKYLSGIGINQSMQNAIRKAVLGNG